MDGSTGSAAPSAVFLIHLNRGPHPNRYMIFSMAEDADTKAKRRRRIRESFVPPLNEIALSILLTGFTIIFRIV